MYVPIEIQWFTLVPRLSWYFCTTCTAPSIDELIKNGDKRHINVVIVIVTYKEVYISKTFNFVDLYTVNCNVLSSLIFSLLL